MWLDVREKNAYEPIEWTTTNDCNLLRLETEEITIQQTQVGREAKKLLQGFIGSVKFLPKEEVDKLPEDEKEALRQKLGPSRNNATDGETQAV